MAHAALAFEQREGGLLRSQTSHMSHRLQNFETSVNVVTVTFVNSELGRL